ncbi:MAG: hypothetical protein ACKVX7_13990 [Planctomycetota bacterium]
MKFGEKLRARYLELEKPVRELLTKLSPSQRMSLGVLAVVVVFGLGVLIFTGGSGSGARGVTIKLSYSPARAKVLAEERIPFEILESDAKIAVDPAVVERCLAVFIEQDLIDGEEDFYAFLHEEQRLTETAATHQARIQNARVRSLERSLELMRGIKKATVHLNTPAESVYVTSNRRTTGASVNVVMTEGRLSRKLGNSMRKSVARTFGVPPDKVSVFDENGEVTANEESGIDATLLAEDEQKYLKDAARHLDGIYGEGSYTLSVDVEHDITSTHGITESVLEPASAKSEVIKETSTNKSGIDSPGVGSNVTRADEKVSGPAILSSLEREETSFKTEFGKSRIEKNTPAGAKVRVTFRLSLALDAVEHQIKIHKEAVKDEKPISQTDIDAHTADLTKFLAGVCALAAEIVSAECFVYAREERTVSEPVSTGLLATVGFVQMHGRELLLGLLALIGCFVLYKAATAAVPELEKLPDPVADLQRFLEERAERERQRALEPDQPSRPEVKINWEVSDQDRQDIELLSAVSEFARDRPEVAATVLRNWMSETLESSAPTGESANANAPVAVEAGVSTSKPEAAPKREKRPS